MDANMRLILAHLRDWWRGGTWSEVLLKRLDALCRTIEYDENEIWEHGDVREYHFRRCLRNGKVFLLADITDECHRLLRLWARLRERAKLEASR